MRKNLIKLLALSALTLSFSLASFADNLVSDGSFESQNGGSSFVTIGPGALGPWNIDSGNIDLIGGYWQAHAGTNSVDMNGVTQASISQLLATTPGQSYNLTF